jgi:D-glycero-alpha-D-manno-heptose-7-phosphate kinase
MIVSKTPFRISFFGGGTDFPEWYNENDSLVISTTIDKYCYIAARFLPPFFNTKYRIVYSETELINDVEKIRHPVVKETIKYLNLSDKSLELIHYADLPSRTGIGSSSSFTVGLLNSLTALSNSNLDKKTLAEKAVHVERELLAENVGCQDQFAAAYGGFNSISFSKNKIKVEKINLSGNYLDELQKHLLLVYTGISRFSSETSNEFVENIEKKHNELNALTRIAEEALDHLLHERDVKFLGRLLDESWRLKSSMSSKISNSAIDALYNLALKHGATGGKILGAGGGGFMLIFADPKYHENILNELKDFLIVPFKFDFNGTQLLNF